jgi:hypothetical protein
MERSLPTRPRLGQILMRSGAATREKLVESWEQKVLFGDRLGTNLLATRAVSEETLARALGEQHLVPAAFGGNIDVKDAAVRRLPRSFAVDRLVVPHHFDAGTLFLLMRDPDDIVTRHDVYRLTGMVVVPVVVAEARIWSLLAQHYGQHPSLRPIPLGNNDGPLVELALAHLDGRVTRSAKTPPLVVDNHAQELMSEAEFTALYVRSNTDELRTVDIAAIEREAQRRSAEAAEEALRAEAQTLASPTESEDLLRPIALQAPTFAMPLDHAPPEVVGVPLEDVPSPAKPSEGWVARKTSESFLGAIDDDGLRADPLPIGVAPAAAAFVRGLIESESKAPLTVVEATALLQTVKGRDALLDIVLRAALSSFRRVVIFTVFPTTISAWREAGEGFTSEMLRGYQVPHTERTVFKMVVESRAHYLGPLQTYRAHGEFVKRTGRKVPASIAVLPVLVGERVVNLIYGDNGHGASVTSDVGELLILTSKISAAFEALLRAER